jgi:tetratricopeptide (TPR) repeat protein
MKLVSTVSLGLMIALGSTAMVAAPAALAQKSKKEKAPEGPKFNMSKEFRAAIGPAQAAIKAGNFPAAEAALGAAGAIAASPDEKYIHSAVSLELAGAKKDTSGQAKAVYGMLASGATPAADAPRLNFFAGGFAYQGGDFPNALRYLKEAERLGYNDVNMYLQLAEANFKLNNLPEGSSYVEKAIAKSEAGGTKAPEGWYSRAASMAYKAKANDLVGKWVRAQVKAYPTPANWRSALVTFRDGTKMDGQVQLDLFRLMDDAKALAGEKDYFEYAALAIERALPGEAKSVIEKGYTLGTVNRTSVAVKERLTEATQRITADRTSVTNDAKRATSAPDGKLAANTANAYLAYGDNAKAIELFELATKKGGIDADMVNTRMGIALARSGQKDAARKAFAAVTGPARKEIAQFWLLYLDLQPTA